MEKLENGVTESVADSEPNLEETAVEETTQQVEEPAAEEPAQEPEIPDSVWAIARKRSEREEADLIAAWVLDTTGNVLLHTLETCQMLERRCF